MCLQEKNHPHQKAFQFRIFLNARGTRGEENPDIRGFLEYVRTNKATDGIASELAASVARVKADAKEKEMYMSLAMDIQMFIDKEKEGWWAEGKAEGKAEGRAEGRNEERTALLVNMLNAGQTPEQIARLTKVPLEDVRAVQARLSRKE